MPNMARRQEPATGIIKERRVNRTLRERFEVVKKMLAPLLRQPENRLAAAIYKTFYRILNRLRRLYPQLSPYELEALIASVYHTLTLRRQRRLAAC